ASVCALYAQVLHNKFTVSWEPTYLDRAIPMYREALADASKVLHLMYFMTEPLHEAIEIYQQCLQYMSEDDSQRIEVLCGLSDALRLRYKHDGQSADVDSSVSLAHKALDSAAIAPEGSIADIDRALDPPSHPAFAEYLGSLIDMLFSRYHILGMPGDLEEALVHCRKIVKLRPDDRIQHLIRISQTLWGLSARYAQTSDPRDLEQMRRLRETVLEFDAKGDMSFAVDILKRNAAVLPGETPTEADSKIAGNEEGRGLYTSVTDRVQILILTANMHALRFDETKATEDFTQAEQTYREALDMLPDRNKEKRREVLQPLSSLFASRFRYEGRTEDLDRAISFAEAALAATRPHSRAHALQESQLGNLIAQRYWDVSDDHNISQLLAAIEHFRSVCDAPECPLYIRFHASLYWSAIAAEHTFADSFSIAMDGYRASFDLLPQLAWLGADTRASLHAIQQSAGLPADAATFALTEGKEKEAVEFLEVGRSVIWNQATRLRTPVDDVAAIAPELAEKLKVLSRSIEGHGVGHANIVSSTTEDDEDTTAATALHTSWRLRQDWLSVIQSIRSLPGFCHFLQRKPFEALASVAREGPVVILTAHERLSVALILPEEGAAPVCVQLKTTVKKLKDLHGTLRKVAHSRGAREDESKDEEEEAALRAGRPGRRTVKTESGDSILSTLWTDVAEPVVKYLTDLKKPKLDDRKRIWWCAVGQMVFMPVHAAGVNSTSGSSVSDFFISSYTPTLDALLHARSRPIPLTSKVLAAIQPNAGKGWSSLPNTKIELREIHGIVPENNLLPLSSPRDNEGEIEGTYTTPTTIIKHLPSASILHLACHRDQQPTNPLQSGFIMRDGERLTVEMLMQVKEQMGEACVAMLGACHTAGNDSERPDEAINLASVMLFVGFRSVGATMWPMGDPDGPVITRHLQGFV
ncbi:hypothetical protein EUX98_g9647, partial [Antrodiella citrinella]